jgi:CheY-like chemotaxis protein
MLILSKLVSQNSEGNLTPKQVEYAKTIHSSGADLLALINDILDLAKIESGTMDLDVSEVPFLELRDFVERTFRQLAQSKGLDFQVLIDPKLPEAISTDSKRLQQILQNLLSNAFKFTERGGITLRIEEVAQGWSPNQVTLNRANGVVAFSVTDTGIGIPADKHKVIFEAFQQADGTTSRKYGGTGLGLSISRGNAGLLGGEIRLTSSPPKGSTFILYLPLTYSPGVPRPSRSHTEGTTPDMLRRVTQRGKGVETTSAAFLQNEIEDDRGEIQPGDRVLLLIEDDVAFACILLDLVRQRGFKGLVALRGETGLELAREFKPDAITLDIELPDMDGWSVLERLKDDLSLRHIPVQIISVSEERQRGLKSGAIAYLNKPVTQEALAEAISDIKGFIERRLKNLLVVEDDEVQRNSIVELIGNGDVHTVAVGSGVEALARLKEEQFQCMVLDLGLPDMTGFELIERIQKEIGLLELPIIVYTGRELTKKDETELRRVADTIIIKDVKSLARLLDETSLFLHRVEGELPDSKRRMLQQLHHTDAVLAGKKVLIIDDDIRNIFALTSVLENHQMQVLYAENGRDGLELLQNTPDVDVVIMDVMMPEMDGYEAMRTLKGMEKFKSLPVIALTAKAMKGDREKCIEAGASDYVTKPVDTDQLLSLLRVWLYR